MNDIFGLDQIIYIIPVFVVLAGIFFFLYKKFRPEEKATEESNELEKIINLVKRKEYKKALNKFDEQGILKKYSGAELKKVAFVYAFACTQNNMKPEALMQLKKIAGSSDKDLSVLYLQGYLMLKDGDKDEAFKIFEKINSIDPKFADNEYYYNLLIYKKGVEELLKNDSESAEKTFKKILNQKNGQLYVKKFNIPDNIKDLKYCELIQNSLKKSASKEEDLEKEALNNIEKIDAELKTLKDNEKDNNKLLKTKCIMTAAKALINISFLSKLDTAKKLIDEAVELIKVFFKDIPEFDETTEENIFSANKEFGTKLKEIKNELPRDLLFLSAILEFILAGETTEPEAYDGVMKKLKRALSIDHLSETSIESSILLIGLILFCMDDSKEERLKGKKYLELSRKNINDDFLSELLDSDKRAKEIFFEIFENYINCHGIPKAQKLSLLNELCRNKEFEKFVKDRGIEIIDDGGELAIDPSIDDMLERIEMLEKLLKTSGGITQKDNTYESKKIAILKQITNIKNEITNTWNELKEQEKTFGF
ncbi:MAG: hypothetical protein ACD_59C00077G0007 [uncultured bacterium]|nr:MAG: hypothetical protein ACD_59C00077G0007 [uncultured bacterium]